MESESRPDGDQLPQIHQIMPASSIILSEERRRLLRPQWEGTYHTLRQMDGLDLGETEPATIFAWEEQ